MKEEIAPQQPQAEKTDNELIAEFMGNRRLVTRDDGTWVISGQGMLKPEYFEYSTSWDWLMPVVEKIARIETNDIIRNGEDSYFDSYFPRTFGMINSETKDFMVRINRNPLHQSPSLIQATYQAVVEFIKWYNAQPKQL